jgi:uncharacterized membrane protein
MDKRLLVLAALLFLLGSASAVTLEGDFSLSMDCESGKNVVYMLYNDSSRARTYTVTAVGENSDWVNINGKWVGEESLEISLEGRQSSELFALVKPQTCYVRPGDYMIRLEIDGRETLNREIEVEVVKSRILELEVIPKSQGAAQCEESYFDISVKNAGQWDEEVSLSIEGLPSSWANLQSDSVSLDGGQTREIELMVKPPCRTEIREYPFTVEASLLGTDFSIKKTASLEIEDRQGIEIEASEMVACAEKASSEEILVRNTGLLDDSLRLSIEGLDWASIQPSQLRIEAEGEETASIVFSGSDAEKGSYEFTVKAYSEKFDKTTMKRMEVELQECYNVTVRAVKLDNKNIEEKPVACIERNPVYTFSIKNGAVEPVEADIRITGVDAIISPSNTVINRGETKTVSVEIDLSNETPGVKKFRFEASGENFSAKQDLEIEALDCYALKVDWDGLIEEIELDQDCKSKVFTAKITNQGEKGQNAEISISGPEWVYTEPKQLALDAGQEQEAYFYIAPPFDLEEGTYTVNASIKGKERTFNRQVEISTFGFKEGPERQEPEPQEPEGTDGEEKLAVSVEAEAKVEELVEETENSAKVTVKISNSGTETLEISAISTADLNAVFEFEPTTLETEETAEVSMTVFLAEGEELPDLVVLKLETNKGLLETPAEILDEEPEDSLAGLFSLAGVDDLLLAAIVIIVIVVFAAIALRSESGSKPESGLKHLADEVKELPGRKLEEIGKHKKLKSLAKEVRKPARKKPAKKKAVKRKGKKK